MHIQTVQITAFQSVSTAAQPPRVPALDATDIEQAMAASTAGALLLLSCLTLPSRCRPSMRKVLHVQWCSTWQPALKVLGPLLPSAAAYSSGDWARREVQLDVVPSHGLAEQSLSDISKALLVVRMWLCSTFRSIKCANPS